MRTCWIPRECNKLGPDSADELPAADGEEPARSAKVWDHMVHEGFADCVGSVVAVGDEDSIL